MNLLIEGVEEGFVIKTELKKKYTIDGITEVYQVYKVRLDCLYYNDQNDRIATWVSQYKDDQNIDNFDIYDIEKYNEIIQKFICASNPEAIKKTQTNIEIFGQREPGLILSDGRIIDGNRRFTCLRNLAKEPKYNKYNYFETVILEKSFENASKEIKMLELMIQHGEERKIDYNPIDRLVGIYNDLIKNKLLTVKEYAFSTNMPEKDVKENKELAQLLVEFLEIINAPKQFYIARDMNLNGPIVELYGILKKVKDDEKKEEIKNIVFINFLMQPEGDMTRFIRKIKSITKSKSKYLDDYIEEQLDIAENVLDKLPPVGKVNKEIINVIKSDEDVKKKLENSLEKADMKIKFAETREKPSENFEKVITLIEGIDTNIFKKLNDEQLSEIKTQLDKLEELLGEVRIAVNV